MKEQTLKRTLVLLMALCVLLASALAYTFLHRDFRLHAGRAQQHDDADPVIASSPQAQGGPASYNQQPAAPVPDGDEPTRAPIQLSPQRLQQIGVTYAIAAVKTVSSPIQAFGSVAMDEERLSYVQTRFPGWIRNVYANATYQYVRKGQRLFTIYSPDLVSTEQEYLLAKQNQKTATSEHMHGTAASEGNWLLDAAAERLRRYDIPAAEIASLEQSGKAQQEIAVESPASGYILERNAIPNAYVQPDTKLYTIADLSTVWVYANVFQTDVGRLKPGDSAQVTLNAYPGRTFNGRIQQILPEVDTTTRTVKVRLVFANPGVILKPGMYVNVTIAAPLGRQLVIPATGVLQSGSRQVAFLDRGNGNLEAREIETGTRIDDSTVVLKGLKEGDRIVSSANFLLDSEAQLQSAMAGFNPPAGTAPSPQTSVARPAEQVHITLDTEPSPPRKGANTLRVHITGPDNKPVAGAQVNVTFYMPAMRGMGMAAMRVAPTLVDKGSGVYEAPVKLPSGGTWEVTITAACPGQPTTTEKIRLNATGGM